MGDNDPIISWEKKSSGDAASDMEEGENAVKVSSTKAHVFVVEKRQRVYSEPYLDVAYNEDSLDEATYNFCEVDYTRADRVIKRFRKDYSEWRKGGAKGAKGQIGNIVAQAEALASRKLTRRASSRFTEESSPSSGTSVERSNKLGFTNALLNSLNYNLGTSLLSVPYFMSRIGWVYVPLLAIFCLISWVTARLLGRMLRTTGAQSYADICNYAFGKRFGPIAAPVLRNVQVLELFSYVAYGNVALHDIIQSFTGPAVSKYTIYFSIFIVSIPMAILRSKYALTLSSKLGLIFYVIILVLVAQDTLHGNPSLLRPANTSLAHGNVFTYLETSGAISLLFAGHAAIPSIYFSLHDEDDFASVSNWTSLILFLLALSLGALGYASYGMAAEPIITLNLRGGVVNAVGQFSLLMKLYFANFLIFSTLVREVEHVIAVLWLQPANRHAPLDLDLESDLHEGLDVDQLPALYNDLDEPLLPPRNVNSSAIIADMESLPRSSVYEGPLFDVFEFARPEPTKPQPEHIHTDPITAVNMGRYLNLDPQALQRLRRSPLRYELARRLSVGQDSAPEIPPKDESFIVKLEVIIRTVLFVLAALAGCFMPSVEFVMAMIGGLLAVNISITFPTVLFCSLGPRAARPAMVLISAFGVTLMMTSTFSTLRTEFSHG